jgi:hypothetical protein
MREELRNVSWSPRSPDPPRKLETKGNQWNLTGVGCSFGRLGGMRNSKLSEAAGDDVLATACLLDGVAIDASVR